MEELRRSSGSGRWDASKTVQPLAEEFPRPKSPAPFNNMPKDLKVSFQHPGDRRARKPDKNSSGDSDNNSNSNSDSSEEKNTAKTTVVKSPSLIQPSPSLRRNSFLTRTKTKSRLIDPHRLIPQTNPVPGEGNSGNVDIRKSGALISGALKSEFDDEDDPFADDDLPEHFKKGNYGALTIIQWVSLVLILISFICSLSIPFLINQTFWGLHLWKWELLILVLICGRLVSGWGVRLVVYILERNLIFKKRLLYFVYGVRKAVQNCVWLSLVIVAWHFLFDEKVEEETHKALTYVTKVLICLLVGTALWLLKTLLVKFLASSFHVSAYFDRIQDSLFNQFVIETLSGPPLIEIQQVQEEEEQLMSEVRKLENAGANIPIDIRAAARAGLAVKSRVIRSGGLERSSPVTKNRKLSRGLSGFNKQQQDEGFSIDQLHQLNQKNISAWKMKRLMNIVRHGFISTLDESVEVVAGEDDNANEIRSEFEAKAAARKIFNNVAKPGAKYVYLVDLMRFLREDEAIKTMAQFEGGKNSDASRVSKSALKNWVVNVFRERKALSLTLNDTKTAVNKLHHMVNIVVGIIVLVVWSLILGIATTHLLVFISSQLLLVVFIFGNTCKTIFEAIIFLFVMHPFDVGDRCEINGVQMIVEEMNILTTIFLRYDNQKITYPNSVLAALPISNYYRSPDMGDSIDFCIHLATPVEKIAIMRERIKGYIESKKEHWHPNPNVVMKDVDDMNKLKMAVWLQHRMNHQNMGERFIRRAHVVEEMIKVFRDLDIEYRMLPLDVNIRNIPMGSSSRVPSTWMQLTSS